MVVNPKTSEGFSRLICDCHQIVALGPLCRSLQALRFVRFLAGLEAVINKADWRLTEAASSSVP
jgi:hypothetical protein